MPDINYIQEIKDYSFLKLKELNQEKNQDYLAYYDKEIKDLQDWWDYGNVNMAKRLWELKTNNRVFNTNSSGSILLFLLGISTINPVENKIQHVLDPIVTGDCPDVDLDFDPRYRGWVKNRIVELFKEENTCSIGVYQTYKTKAVIVDVSRALGLDVASAMEVTKPLNSLLKHENDDGTEEVIDQMEWDEIFELYPILKTYMEENPDVLTHCKVLRNQVKNMGKHAGGMIISNINLQDKIPVIRDKSGLVVSSWMEGQAEHELSNVGLVKFDILGLSNLSIISECIKYVEKTRGVKLGRHNIPLNNRDAIKFCSKNDLVGIFQFESPQTKPLADAVGMDCLNDISAVTSLLRPGPHQVGLDAEYAERKNGKKYHLPECLVPVLGSTYGILTYQEQCVGFSNTIRTPLGSIPIGEIVEKRHIKEVLCFNDDGDMVIRPIEQYHDNGLKELYKLTFDNGRILECTEDHRVLVKDKGWVQIKDLTPDDEVITEEDFIVEAETCSTVTIFTG